VQGYERLGAKRRFRETAPHPGIFPTPRKIPKSEQSPDYENFPTKREKVVVIA
jgi:hypothetical protein